MLPTYNRNLAFGKNSAYLRQFWRADERTRTADLLITSLLAHVLARTGASGFQLVYAGFGGSGA
jgi:hypothetical protein